MGPAGRLEAAGLRVDAGLQAARGSELLYSHNNHDYDCYHYNYHHHHYYHMCLNYIFLLISLSLSLWGRPITRCACGPVPPASGQLLGSRSTEVPKLPEAIKQHIAITCVHIYIYIYIYIMHTRIYTYIYIYIYMNKHKLSNIRNNSNIKTTA